MTEFKFKPDGYAVVLHLIEAARAWSRPEARWCGPEEQDLTAWVERLESSLAEIVPEEQGPTWQARTWGEVLPGDTVSLGGVEALVKEAVTNTWNIDARDSSRIWHEGPDARDDEGNIKRCRTCKGRCSRSRGFSHPRMPHTQTPVTLEWDGRARRYEMATGGEIEVLRGNLGQETDRAAGRGSDLVKADREAVLASWAADAFTVLSATGLSPEPLVMSPEEP